MRIFDRIDPGTLDRRDQQLWMLAVAMIVILALGVALMMYSTVFSAPVTISGAGLRKGFFSFCILCLLFVSYLVDRQLTIRKLRRVLVEEQRRNIELRERASADLLNSLPGLGHFQDRLPMEFRRAANSRRPLSLLIVRLEPSAKLPDGGEIGVAFGDAAKALLRKLRGEDSIYLLSWGVFGIVLPGVSGADAKGVVGRLAEGLTDASGALGRFSFDIRMNNYPDDAMSAREMEQMACAGLFDSRAEPRPA